jgi:hypothetical protein
VVFCLELTASCGTKGQAYVLIGQDVPSYTLVQ